MIILIIEGEYGQECWVAKNHVTWTLGLVIDDLVQPRSFQWFRGTCTINPRAHLLDLN